MAAEVLRIELANRKNSNFIKEGTGGDTGIPAIHLDSSSVKFLKTVSHKKVYDNPDDKTKYRIIKTRYIRGCDTLDPVEQERRGFKPNKAHDLQDLTIVGGVKEVENNGATMVLYEYLKTYEGNADYEDRPDNVLPEFREIKDAIKAESFSADFETELQAKNLVSQLRRKKGNGTYVYEEEQIDMFIKTLGLPYYDNHAERFNAILNVANVNPGLFVNKLHSVAASILTNVTSALKMKTIVIENGTVVFNGTKVTQLDNMNDEDRDGQITELAQFFTTKAGSVAFEEIQKFNQDLLKSI